jgi:hypothetical protein
MFLKNNRRGRSRAMAASQANDDLIEALIHIPSLRQAERRTCRAWCFNPPASLIYAVIGKALADNFGVMTPPHRQYVAGVIRVGLALRDHRKDLVRRALVGTLRARAQCLGKERALLIDAYIKHCFRTRES